MLSTLIMRVSWSKQTEKHLSYERKKNLLQLNWRQYWKTIKPKRDIKQDILFQTRFNINYSIQKQDSRQTIQPHNCIKLTPKAKIYAITRKFLRIIKCSTILQTVIVVDVESHPKKGHKLFQSNFFTRPPKQASL